MKNGLHMNPLLFKMVILVTCFMLVMLYNKSKGADISIKKDSRHTIVAVRQLLNKKSKKIINAFALQRIQPMANSGED